MVPMITQRNQPTKMSNKINNDGLTFWDHLDELRTCFIRIFVAVFVCGIVAFCFKDFLFKIVLAPKSPDFLTYQFFTLLGADVESFNVQLINTELAQQFLIHLKVAMYAGVVCVSPYIIYALFHFISPALYSNEKKASIQAIGGGYVMFLLGVLLTYFLIFPLTFRFLGTYQVSNEVTNYISLTSYISTLLVLCLLMGILFEIPIVCWLLARFGFLKHDFMKHYRRHAIVAICITAAIITPTADAFTLGIVALPIYLLYEFSIFIVKRTNRRS